MHVHIERSQKKGLLSGVWHMVTFKVRLSREEIEAVHRAGAAKKVLYEYELVDGQVFKIWTNHLWVNKDGTPRPIKFKADNIGTISRLEEEFKEALETLTVYRDAQIVSPDQKEEEYEL